MKGLLLKDILWAASQKILWIVILFLIVMYAGSGAGVLMIGMMPLILVILMVKSILADLQESSSRFLFTLPFSRTAYVNEKFVLCMGAGLLCDGILLAIMCILHPEDRMAFVLAALYAAAMVVFICAVMVPLTIRFKSKATILGMVCMMVILLSISTSDEIIVWAQNLSMIRISLPMLSAIVAAALAVLCVGSWGLSVRFINREEI